MRIHFLNRGHAERCLKNCRAILEKTLSTSKLPAHRLRNAFSQGWGYSSYEELIRFLSLHTATDSTTDQNALLDALIKGFRLSLELARTGGFHVSGNVESLALRSAQRALRMLSLTDPDDEHAALPSVPPYRRTIEGRKFFVDFSVDGPYVGDGKDGVPIGASSIVKLAVPWRLPQLMNWNPKWELPSRWVVVKYDREIRIDLSYLSEYGRREFSQQFGVPISNYPYGEEDQGALFLQSSAFLVLDEWAKANPQLAKRLKFYCPYIPNLPVELERFIGKAV